MLLKNKLNSIIGKTGVNWRYQLKLWGCALISAAFGLSIKWFVPLQVLTLPIPRAMIVLGFFGVIYFTLTYLINIEESHAVINKIKSKILRIK